MKVEHLIALLVQLDPELPVLLADRNTAFGAQAEDFQVIDGWNDGLALLIAEHDRSAGDTAVLTNLSRMKDESFSEVASAKEERVPGGTGFGRFGESRTPLQLRNASEEGWQPWAGDASVTATSSGWVVVVGEREFSPCHDVNAVGTVCFAYGLDNTCFADVAPDTDTRRWMVWNWCRLLSIDAFDESLGMRRMESLMRAMRLAPDVATVADLVFRFETRRMGVAKELKRGSSRPVERSEPPELEPPRRVAE